MKEKRTGVRQGPITASEKRMLEGFRDEKLLQREMDEMRYYKVDEYEMYA